jgi:hypothetical protein
VAISRKRGTNARRIPKSALVAGPLALVATATVVTAGVLAGQPEPAPRPVSAGSAVADVGDRAATVSRSESRRDLARKVRGGVVLERAYHVDMSRAAVAGAVRGADQRRWTTARLNLWSNPGDQAADLGLVEDETKVLLTGRHDMGRDEIVVDGRARWVTAGHLDDSKPVVVEAVAPQRSSRSAARPAPAAPAAPVAATCSNGTSVPSGVSQNVVAVHEAVCANFPEITTYGTFSDDGGHSQGLAVDIMVSGSRGWQVAEFVRAHSAELGVNYVMYSQKIWSVDRSGEGWRYVEDRGSATANHYDHVHVTTY